MKSDFITAINQICSEKALSREVVLEAIQSALVSAYKRVTNTPQTQVVRVIIDQNTGAVKVFSQKEVVNVVNDPRIEIKLQDARDIDSEAKVGQFIEVDTTPNDFGRIAAQTAKQVVFQRLREAERDMVYNEYMARIGDILTGIVQRSESKSLIIDLGKAEAILPLSEQVQVERYRPGQRIKVFLVEVNKSSRGPQLIVSRAHKDLLKRLFEIEVPEVYNGIIEIKAIAREPGSRSKIAVAALQDGVDAVGSCVGLRGTRIMNVVNELHGEKIDVVQWDPNPKIFVANALSPAQVTSVILNEEDRTAVVTVPEKQLSLAIGKEGQNARLSAKLTGWRIDIKSGDGQESDTQSSKTLTYTPNDCDDSFL